MIDETRKDCERMRNQKHRRIVSEGNPSAYEMQPPRTRPETHRLRSSDQVSSTSKLPSSVAGNSMKYSEFETDMRQRNTTGQKMSDGLKKRFGSLRKRKQTTEV
jgi:hypothetical protein